MPAGRRGAGTAAGWACAAGTAGGTRCGSRLPQRVQKLSPSLRRSPQYGQNIAPLPFPPPPRVPARYPRAAIFLTMKGRMPPCAM